MIRPKTGAEIELMRAAGKQLAEILQILSKKTVAGATGNEIDELAEKETLARGLSPILKGYRGYPKSLCVSINEAVVHGIPNDRPFQEGDVVKLDLSIANKGMVVDAATTVVIGQASTEVKRLVETTERSLELGIGAIKGQGTKLGDIGSVIQTELEKNKLGVVRDLVGHGVGHGLHEEPDVLNYGSRGSGQALPVGTTIAIEPMATLGGWQVGMLPDGWTVVTVDGSLAAHFEHTVLVVEGGAEILTN